MNWKHGIGALLLMSGILIPAAAQDSSIGLSSTEIAALPQIALTPLEPREDLMYDRRYMKVTSAADVYDAPNGTVVRHLDPGFVYVTALGDENGWTRINRNEWVPSDTLKSVTSVVSHLTGVILPETPLPYPFGWMITDAYTSPTPGVEADVNTPGAALIDRYSIVNLYSSTVVKDADGNDRIWYQVGENQWIHQFTVSKFEPLKAIPEGVDTDLWFSIDLYEQNITLYRGLTPVFATLVGTGLPRWPTQEGLFHIYYRAERENMSWGTVGDDYYLLEEVPWTMYFDDGRALHGAYWHNGFGFRRSHGCVNMSITDAHYMYEQVAEFLGADAGSAVDGPAVYIYSSGVYDNP